MINGSVGALHVALVAAFLGWIVFSFSHSAATWQKRNAGSSSTRTIGWLIVAMLLSGAALAGGWLNRELQRRAGIISGTDFFVVRARTGATPHLAESDSVTQGAMLASFDSSETVREEQRLRGEIAVLEEQMNAKRLQPLVLNPELLRRSQETSDVQRARLTELGFGALGAGLDKTAPSTDLTAAERAKNAAADRELQRTRELVNDGILPREKLDAAVASAQAAAQALHEREQLVKAAQSGLAVQSQIGAEISRDGDRAREERSAEVSELQAQLAERRTDLLELVGEQAVKAPFRGSVVYRNPSPALAANGQVILAVARGAGFVATVQVPARDVSMLVPGQTVRLKLEHSLVSEEISGQLASVQPAPGADNRATLLIDCNLPPEQFAAISSESVPVTLEWRPPLYSDRITQLGLLLAAFVAAIWLVLQVRALLRRNMVEALAAIEADLDADWMRMPESEPLRRSGHPSTSGASHPERARAYADELPASIDRSVEMAGSAR